MLPCWSLVFAISLAVSLSKPNHTCGHQVNSTDVEEKDEKQVKRTNYVYPMLGGNFSKPPVVVYPMSDDHSQSFGRQEMNQPWTYSHHSHSGTSAYPNMRYAASHFPDSSVNWNSLDQTRGGFQQTNSKSSAIGNETFNPDVQPLVRQMEDTHHHRDAPQYSRSNEVLPLNTDSMNTLMERPAAVQPYHHPHHLPQAQHRHQQNHHHSSDPTNTQTALFSPYESFRVITRNPGNRVPDQNLDQHPKSNPAMQPDSGSQSEGAQEHDRRTPDTNEMKEKPESPDGNRQDVDRSLVQAYRYHERLLYQRFQELCIQIRGVRCDDGSLLHQNQQSHSLTSYPMTPVVRLPGYGYRY